MDQMLDLDFFHFAQYDKKLHQNPVVGLEINFLEEIAIQQTYQGQPVPHDVVEYLLDPVWIGTFHLILIPKLVADRPLKYRNCFGENRDTKIKYRKIQKCEPPIAF